MSNSPTTRSLLLSGVKRLLLRLDAWEDDPDHPTSGIRFVLILSAHAVFFG